MCTTFLYSPANFFLGLRVWFARRADMSLTEAAHEAKLNSINWGRVLVVGALAALFMLWVFIVAVPKTAPSAMTALASTVTSGQLMQLAGGLVMGLLAAAALFWLRRGAQTYVFFCRLGYEERLRRGA